MKNTIRTPEKICKCGYMLDATSQVGGESTPSEGDFTVCLKCGELWVFNNDITVREPTLKEFQIFSKLPEAKTVLQMKKLFNKIKSQPPLS